MGGECVVACGVDRMLESRYAVKGKEGENEDADDGKRKKERMRERKGPCAASSRVAFRGFLGWAPVKM